MTYLRFVAAAIAISLVAGAAHAAAPPFTLQQVAPGDYMHMGQNLMVAADHDDVANLGLVAGTRCAAVIDTGGSVATGRAFRAAIAKITQKPICYVINTHVHPDHILGNAAFVHPGTIFVGSATLPEALGRQRAGYLETFRADLGADPAAALVPPQKTVPVGGTLTLDLGGRQLQLRAWPPAHTGTDLTVFDARTRTLFAGDLLFRKRIPALDGNLDGWLKVAAQLARFAPAPAVVVPGHGPVGHDLAKDLQPEREYLARLRKSTCAYIGNGGDLQDAATKIMPDNRQHWLLWTQRQPINIQKAFQELQWSCF